MSRNDYDSSIVKHQTQGFLPFARQISGPTGLTVETQLELGRLPNNIQSTVKLRIVLGIGRNETGRD